MELSEHLLYQNAQFLEPDSFINAKYCQDLKNESLRAILGFILNFFNLPMRIQNRHGHMMLGTRTGTWERDMGSGQDRDMGPGPGHGTGTGPGHGTGTARGTFLRSWRNLALTCESGSENCAFWYRNHPESSHGDPF